MPEAIKGLPILNRHPGLLHFLALPIAYPLRADHELGVVGVGPAGAACGIGVGVGCSAVLSDYGFLFEDSRDL